MIQMEAIRPFSLAGRQQPFRRGELYEIDAPTARDHERRGLARKPGGEKMAPEPDNKMAPPASNKGNTQAGGEGAHASASLPARALPQTTARSSKPGAKAKKRKGA